MYAFQLWQLLECLQDSQSLLLLLNSKDRHLSNSTEPSRIDGAYEVWKAEVSKLKFVDCVEDAFSFALDRLAGLESSKNTVQPGIEI